METILERLEKLEELSIDEVQQLAADIRTEYATVRESGEINLDHVEQLSKALATVGAQEKVLTEEAEKALAQVKELDEAMGFSAEDPTAEADAPAPGEKTEDKKEAKAEDEADADSDDAGEDDSKDEDDADADKAEDKKESKETAKKATKKEEAKKEAKVASTRILKMPSLKQKTPVSTPEASSDADKGLILDGDGKQSSETNFASMFNKAIGQLPKHFNSRMDEVRRTAATLLVDENVVPKVGRFSNFAESNDAIKDLIAKKNAEADEVATLKASGGPCVARRQEFALDVIGGDCEPVAAALPTVQSDGKGTSFYTSIEAFSEASLDSSSNIYTAAEDLSGAEYPKDCGTLDCPTPTNCDKEIIEQCLEIGNWVSFAWPEYVAAIKAAADAHLARTGEQNRLKKIYDYAVAQTNKFTEGAQPSNANAQLLDVILRYVAFDRRGSRDCSNARYNVLLQEGLEDQLRVDVARSFGFGTTSMSTDNAVFEVLNRANINISFYKAKDQFGTPTGDAGAAQPALIGTGAAVPAWNATTRIGIMRDDAVYRELGPTLDLGVFRTQEDFETNNYHLFMEYWEAVCFRNKHVFIVDTPLCANGVFSAGATAPTCA